MHVPSHRQRFLLYLNLISPSIQDKPQCEEGLFSLSGGCVCELISWSLPISDDLRSVIKFSIQKKKRGLKLVCKATPLNEHEEEYCVRLHFKGIDHFRTSEFNAGFPSFRLLHIHCSPVSKAKLQRCRFMERCNKRVRTRVQKGIVHQRRNPSKVST